MSTVPIKATLPSPDDQTAVTAVIASLKQKLPFLITLAPADRQTTPRTGGKVQGVWLSYWTLRVRPREQPYAAGEV